MWVWVRELSGEGSSINRHLTIDCVCLCVRKQEENNQVKVDICGLISMTKSRVTNMHPPGNWRRKPQKKTRRVKPTQEEEVKDDTHGTHTQEMDITQEALSSNSEEENNSSTETSLSDDEMAVNDDRSLPKSPERRLTKAEKILLNAKRIPIEIRDNFKVKVT